MSTYTLSNKCEYWLMFQTIYFDMCICIRNIKESVDSLCRDGTNMPI